MIKTYLEAGKIINKRGLAGELKIESYCDTPEAFCSFKHVYLAPDGTDVRKVLSAKLYNGYAYIRLEGVTTAEQADKLRGKSLISTGMTWNWIRTASLSMIFSSFL